MVCGATQLELTLLGSDVAERFDIWGSAADGGSAHGGEARTTSPLGGPRTSRARQCAWTASLAGKGPMSGGLEVWGWVQQRSSIEDVR